MDDVRELNGRAMALQLENVAAAEARPPLVDEFIYLKGRPPLRSFLNFVHEDVVDEEARDTRRMKEEWHEASDYIDELEGGEAGVADDPIIGSLPPRLEPLRDELFNDPVFQNGFGSANTDVGIVELDRLVVFQKHINLTFVNHLKNQLGPQPSDEDVFRLALPFDHPQPDVKWMRNRSDSYVVLSTSNDLRFLGSVFLDPSQLHRNPVSGPLVGIIGLAVGFGSNFLNAIHVENRLVLNNGSHRAFTLRDLGFTHVPCLIQHIASREELRALGSSDLRRNPHRYLDNPRPSMLRDYFNPRLRRIVFRARELRQVRVKFDVDEAYIPAIWPE